MSEAKVIIAMETMAETTWKHEVTPYLAGLKTVQALINVAPPTKNRMLLNRQIYCHHAMHKENLLN